MTWWHKKPKVDLSLEQCEADKYVARETQKLDINRAEHHNLSALSPMDTFRAYVILAERGGKK